MDVHYTTEALREFQSQTIKDFEAAKIKAPVHLSDGNEDHLIYLFSRLINPQDWVLGSWRNSSQCLLKGVPKEEVRQAISGGHSISLCFPQYKVLSSAIVGGILPIAVGLGWAIKNRQKFSLYNRVLNHDEILTDTTDKDIQIVSRENSVAWPSSDENEHVWVFVGDTTSLSGEFYEALQYVKNFDLPVNFVVEDNGLSVYTPTATVWNINKHPHSYTYDGFVNLVDDHVYYYQYTSRFPHSGTGGKKVTF